MEPVARAAGLVLFGISLTWLLSVVLGRLITRRGVAFWVWDRSGAIGRILIAIGFALAVWGLAQGTSTSASSLIALGALVGMAGIWLILPGP